MKLPSPRTLAEADLVWLTQAVLDELGQAALVIDGAHAIVLANAAGHGLLSRAGPDAEAAIGAAARGEPNPLGLTVRAGPNGAGLRLLTAREEGDPRLRRAQTASSRWSLTRRQSQVLGELILGRGNKDIAERLACSPKTVELHVSAILAAAGVASRAELLSLLLREA